MKQMNETKLFEGISREGMGHILTCSGSEVQEYAPGEYIFRQDERPVKLFLLLEGKVNISKDFASGRRNMLYSATEGEVFGEIFLSKENKSYWYDAVAATEVKVLSIPWRYFFDFCEHACAHHQKITGNMLEIQSEKNFEMTKKIHLLSGTGLRRKIAIFLYESKELDGSVEMVMNREEFADYLGVARPSLSRELMNMQEEGIILVEKEHIQIIDMQEIENLYSS